MSDTINGYPIIQQQPTPKAHATRAGAVILVNKGHGYHPYVTAWRGQDDGKWDNQWCWGHYFDSKLEALSDYNSRVQRGY